ncbi:hypothetical protein ACWF9B_01055 [Streptomyces sp. NPDC055089]
MARLNRGEVGKSGTTIRLAAIWDPTVKFSGSLATANNNGASLEEFKGNRVSEIRATYELLTQTFLKEIPLP